MPPKGRGAVSMRGSAAGARAACVIPAPPGPPERPKGARGTARSTPTGPRPTNCPPGRGRFGAPRVAGCVDAPQGRGAVSMRGSAAGARAACVIPAPPGPPERPKGARGTARSTRTGPRPTNCPPGRGRFGAPRVAGCVDAPQGRWELRDQPPPARGRQTAAADDPPPARRPTSRTRGPVRATPAPAPRGAPPFGCGCRSCRSPPTGSCGPWTRTGAARRRCRRPSRRPPRPAARRTPAR